MLPGNRGKSGQVTVAPVKAWRGSPAEAPRPLTAAEVNTPPLPCAMDFSFGRIPPAVTTIEEAQITSMQSP